LVECIIVLSKENIEKEWNGRDFKFTMFLFKLISFITGQADYRLHLF